ncbi:MAG TPA: YjfB family protein [Chloroflexota bacterium]|nr:YjfB family protein [Chloroflexota bacterium]
MGVGNVSGAATAAVMSQLKGADVRSVVGLAVMRQIQDQQKQMGQEMLDMINSSTPSPNGVGQRIDIRV